MPGNRDRYALQAFRHEALDDTGSTNTECLVRAKAGEADCLRVTARRQLAGRGRRGRQWTSEPGNLYASLLLIDPAPLEETASLPLAVAVAVQATIAAVLPTGREGVEIKWPNDILIGRRKTCGILLEAEMLPDGRRALVIGIGINIRHKPDTAPYAVTCLAEHGCNATPEFVFAHLFNNMANILCAWDEGRGMAEIMRPWRSAACGIGEQITVNLPNRSLVGRFAGIDDAGLLLLEATDGRLQSIAAGDVFLGRLE